MPKIRENISLIYLIVLWTAFRGLKPVLLVPKGQSPGLTKLISILCFYFNIRHSLLFINADGFVREGGEIGLINTLVPKVFKHLLVLKTLGTYYSYSYLILIDWFMKLIVQMFQQLIVIYRSDNFVHHYWGCTSIYQPLS